MNFHERVELIESLIENIMKRKNYLTAYEQGYMDAIITIPHSDSFSDDHLTCLIEIDKKLIELSVFYG